MKNKFEPLRRQRITADKREIKDFPKLPLATSFIRETLGEMLTSRKYVEREKVNRKHRGGE